MEEMVWGRGALTSKVDGEEILTFFPKNFIVPYFLKMPTKKKKNCKNVVAIKLYSFIF